MNEASADPNLWRWYKRGPLKGRWISPNRRRRVRLWFDYGINRWEDVVFDRRWPDWCYAPEWGVLDRLFRFTCRVVGHRVVNDHCGRADHRYCEVCSQQTPHAGVRR
jgi:hypothetical protein